MRSRERARPLLSPEGPSHHKHLVLARRIASIFLLASTAAMLAVGQQKINSPLDVNVYSRVSLQTHNVSSKFADAVSKDAIKYICSDSEADLLNHFTLQGVPFNNSLIRSRKGKKCHIHYDPTVPGFRAHAESDPVDELTFTVDSRTFFAPTTKPLGSSLEIAQAMATKSKTPPALRIQINLELGKPWQDQAITRLFGALGAQVKLHHHNSVDASAWTQDFMKSGSAGQRRMVLIPRHSFEGDVENGPMLDPILKSMEDTDWVRSRLSWDGGDLMFAHHPLEPSRLILIHGDAARMYWAKGLSNDEYAYILMREFGADEAIFAGEIASHVDYAVNLLPDGRTAVLAAPRHGEFALSREALDQLIQNHGPLPNLVELKRLHALPDGMIMEHRPEILSLLEEAAASYVNWPRSINLATMRQATAYTNRHCPDDRASCTSAAGLEALLTRDPELAQKWVTAASEALIGESLSKALLGIVASQIAEVDTERSAKLASLQKRLQASGFRVVHVPVLGGGRRAQLPWAGISYANFIALGDKVFVPVFGLGAAELALLQELQNHLPRPYRVEGVYARGILAQNGGIHCVVGVKRLGWESGVFPSVISQRHQLRLVNPPPRSLVATEE